MPACAGMCQNVITAMSAWAGMCQHVPACARLCQPGICTWISRCPCAPEYGPGIGLLVNSGACAGTWQTIHANPYRTNGILHVPDACLSRFSRLLKKNFHDLHVPAMCQERISQTAMKPMVFFIFGRACASTCQHMPQLDGQPRKSALACASM